MYFCKYDMGEMASMIYNWDSDQVIGSNLISASRYS